jgi:ATP synthase protein I
MHPLKGDRTHGHQWGLRVGTEMVASTMIGLGSGYMMDRWLGTRPLFLLLFFAFGVAAGFINLYYVMVVHDRSQSDQENR